MKKFIDLIPFIFLFLLTIGIGFSVVYFTGIIDFSKKEKYNLIFNCNDFTMEVGSSVTLDAHINPINKSEIKWESSDTDIAVVENGIVTSKKEGIAIITAKSEAYNKSAICTVTVKNETIKISSIELEKYELSLLEEETYKLNATILPKNASNKNLIWESSDNKIATVDNGTIKALKKGTVTITVKSSDGSVKTICTVKISEKIKEIPVSEIKLEKEKVDMYVGETFKVNFAIEPSNATNKTITWSSSNTNVVTVNNGVVTAKSAGMAIVTATSNGKTSSVTITVNNQIIPVSSISLNKKSDTIYLNSSVKTISLTATVLPSNATNKIITWSSSDTNVATVNNGVVTIKNPGTAIIKATVDGKSSSYTITVKQKIIVIIGASQVERMNRYNKSYVSQNGNTYTSSDNTLKYIYKSGSGIPYQYVGGEGWNNALSFINNYNSLKNYTEFHIFFPLSGNEIKNFTCDQISPSNTSIQTFAQKYNESIQNLKSQNYNVKGYVVSMHPVKVTEAESDNVVTNQNKNSCTAGYRSNVKYLTFNKAIKSVIVNKYQNNLKYESLFVRIMTVNNEGKNYSFKWDYYHTTDGIHWDEKTSKLYVKEMLDYSDEL